MGKLGYTEENGIESKAQGFIHYEERWKQRLTIRETSGYKKAMHGSLPRLPPKVMSEAMHRSLPMSVA